MLALSIALALSAHVIQKPKPFDAQSVGPLASASVSSGAQTANLLIPYGQAFGTYSTPTWFANGSMLALMEDAAGHPLWSLDAEIWADGTISGQLNLLRYQSNPAASLVALSVTGHAVLDSQGEGPFSATIYSLSLGAIPIYPMGTMQGLLKSTPAGQVGPVLTGKSGLVAAAFQADDPNLPVSSIAPGLDLRGNVIVCPKGPDYYLAKLQAAANLSKLPQAAAQSRAGNPVIIFCPKEPGNGSFNVQPVGSKPVGQQVSEIGASTDPDISGFVPTHVVDASGASTVDFIGATAAGAHAQVGAAQVGVEGLLCLRWSLHP